MSCAQGVAASSKGMSARFQDYAPPLHGWRVLQLPLPWALVAGHGMELVPRAMYTGQCLAAAWLVRPAAFFCCVVWQGMELVARAIRSGIYNDLGSGSNVDLCIITKGKVCAQARPSRSDARCTVSIASAVFCITVSSSPAVTTLCPSWQWHGCKADHLFTQLDLYV